MAKINYTTQSDARSGDMTHSTDVVQIELQGLPEKVAAIATLLRQQTDVLEESSDTQEQGTTEMRRMIVKEISDLTPIIPNKNGQEGWAD